jgi:hypothetical protein
MTEGKDNAEMIFAIIELVDGSEDRGRQIYKYDSLKDFKDDVETSEGLDVGAVVDVYRLSLAGNFVDEMIRICAECGEDLNYKIICSNCGTQAADINNGTATGFKNNAFVPGVIR